MLAVAGEIVQANFAEDLQGWSSLAVAVLGIPALAGTLVALIQSQRDAKRARTLDYLSRLFALEFAPLNTQVVAFLKTGNGEVFEPGCTLTPPPDSKPPSIPGAMEAYEALSLDTKAKIVLVLNFYEELSGSYRAGLLDEKIAQNMLVPVLIYAWDAASWFIQYKRDNLEERENKEIADEAMCEWQCLVRDLAGES